MNIFRSKKSLIFYSLIFVLILLIIVIISLLYLNTGLFTLRYIDDKDLTYWERNDDGIILGDEAFSINGNNETCWLMIHGYSSGPQDMRLLAETVSDEFNDSVYVPRLNGHGEVPSRLLNLTLDDWYEQIEQDHTLLNTTCDAVNVVGFSFGGTLALRLSEEKSLKNTYLISPYLSPKKFFLPFLDFSWYLNTFADDLVYIKKYTLAQINSDEYIDDYISYWAFNFRVVQRSSIFIEETANTLSAIKNPVLLQHSTKDLTADFSASEYILDEISSSQKKLISYNASNHILLFDYDRDEVIQQVIAFEQQHR